ncbi:MAG: two-component regulator propeller domain-containing protein, partial [Bacteroidota bacterium]
LCHHYDPNAQTSDRRTDGIGGRYVYSVLEDKDCRIWMGVSAKGVTVFDKNQGFRSFGWEEGFLDIKVKSLFQDRKNRIWLGTEGAGLALFQDSSFRFFDGSSGLSDNWIRDIVEDKKGRLWVATAGGGLTRMEEIPDTTGPRFRFEYFREKEGLRSNRLNSLHLDQEGRIWIATASRGLSMIDAQDQITNLPLQDGQYQNAIRSLAEDHLGYLWMGTAGGGLLRLNMYPESGTYRFSSYRDGLTSGNVYLLAFDELGDLWAGSESGLDRLSFDPLQEPIAFRHFGQTEGFVGIETCQNSITRDRNGDLWVGTINGMTRFNPVNRVQSSRAPRLHLAQVRLFYQPIQQSPYRHTIGAWNQQVAGLTLPADENHLSFSFSAIDLQSPEGIQYSWWLEGGEKSWSPYQQEKSSTYSNLAPGTYTFHLRAKNIEGLESQPVKFSFAVEPPFWETWWFILGAIAVLGGLIFAFFRYRLNQVRQLAVKDREKLEVEKGLVELEQKALRLQMNPHFIFNALNSIQGLITEQDTKTARYYLAKFSKLMRMVLENSREGLIPVEEEIQTLEHYMAIERFCSGEKFEYEISVDEAIDPEEVLIPAMMIQPFIENAIIHGISHLPEKGHIKVQFRPQTGWMEVSVTDNGIGRNKAAQINAQQKQHHKSTALLVTQERLDLLTEDQNWSKSIQIIDLKTSKGAPAGTKVVVRIPWMRD